VKIRKDKIVDLSYLQDFSFSELEIDAPGFKNIDAINGNKSLKTLAVRGEYTKIYLPGFGTAYPGYVTETMDLGSLTNLPALEKIVLGPGIRNVEFLKNITSIKELEIEDAQRLTGIESLSNLKKLTIGECSALESLSPLKQLKLKSLNFFTTRFNKSLWIDFVDFIMIADGLEIDVDKYKNIPKKRILALEDMEGICDFYFNEDSYWGNSFSFKIERKKKRKSADKKTFKE
jgi:hypothetical protein